MAGSVKGTFVVSDELTIPAPGLELQPGSGHSCAVELRKGEGALHGCVLPKQFGPKSGRHYPHVFHQRQFDLMTKRCCPQ